MGCYGPVRRPLFALFLTFLVKGWTVALGWSTRAGLVSYASAASARDPMNAVSARRTARLDSDSHNMEPLTRRCSTTNRSGDRCGRSPIPGGMVCKFHGGGAPQTIAAARARLSMKRMERVYLR